MTTTTTTEDRTLVLSTTLPSAAPVPVPPPPPPTRAFGELEAMAKAIVSSGFFPDCGNVAQAVTKMLLAQALGLDPMLAFASLKIIKGRPVLGYDLIAARIQRSGRYSYEVVELSAARCSLRFYDRDQALGLSDFTLQDAQSAGLTGNTNYQKFPKNMLFARALTNGARWYCPEVFGAAIYDPSELAESEEPARTIPRDTPPASPEPVIGEQGATWFITGMQKTDIAWEALCSYITDELGWDGLRTPGDLAQLPKSVARKAAAALRDGLLVSRKETHDGEATE